MLLLLQAQISAPERLTRPTPIRLRHPISLPLPTRIRLHRYLDYRQVHSQPPSCNSHSEQRSGSPANKSAPWAVPGWGTGSCLMRLVSVWKASCLLGSLCIPLRVLGWPSRLGASVFSLAREFCGPITENLTDFFYSILDVQERANRNPALILTVHLSRLFVRIRVQGDGGAFVALCRRCRRWRRGTGRTPSSSWRRRCGREWVRAF